MASDSHIQETRPIGPELFYFSRCILEDNEPEPSGLEGLADVRIINALLESAGAGKPIEIKPIEKKERPTLDQEIYEPPVETGFNARSGANKMTHQVTAVLFG